MLDKTAETAAPTFATDEQTTRQPSIRKLPNLSYPDIRPIRADRFVIDITEGRQRDPELRVKKLERQFGKDGEKFDFEKFEVVTAIPRPDGTYFPSGGMGRVWAVVNLLKRPDLALPTLIRRQSGDQAEKKAFIHSQTNTVPITPAQLFMTLGHLDGKGFSEHRAIVEEMEKLQITTVPGMGARTVTHSAAVFCGRLGKLTQAYTMARQLWYTGRTAKSGEYTHKVEGTAMTALGAFLYCFDGPKLDYKRIEKLFAGLDYVSFKDTACQKFLKPGRQGRDDAWAVCREMILRYNRGQQKNKLDHIDLLVIREDFKDDPFFKLMHDAWRMYDPDERDDRKGD